MRIGLMKNQISRTRNNNSFSYSSMTNKFNILNNLALINIKASSFFK